MLHFNYKSKMEHYCSWVFCIMKHVEYFIFYRNLKKKKLTNYIFKYFLTFLHLLQIYYFFKILNTFNLCLIFFKK